MGYDGWSTLTDYESRCRFTNYCHGESILWSDCGEPYSVFCESLYDQDYCYDHGYDTTSEYQSIGKNTWCDVQEATEMAKAMTIAALVCSSVFWLCAVSGPFCALLCYAVPA